MGVEVLSEEVAFDGSCRRAVTAHAMLSRVSLKVDNLGGDWNRKRVDVFQNIPE